MRWLWGSAFLAAWLALPASAAAEEEDRIPFILGLGVRRSSGDAQGYELFSAGTLAVLTRDNSLAVTYVGAIGSDGSGPSGTLAYSLSYGPVLGPGAPVTSGLALRSGVDVLIDSLGTLRTSYLALPLLQAGYVYGKGAVELDVGLGTAPVLLGRLRFGEDVRRFGFGAKAGPYLRVLLLRAGLSASLSADHLLASSAGGGRADWARGLLCASFWYLDVCAAGSLSSFEPPARPGASVTAGYAGGALGFNVARVGGGWASLR